MRYLTTVLNFAVIVLSAPQSADRSGTILGGPDENHGELLPANYTFIVRPLAERRMMLAGYRLADILKETFD